MLASRWLMLAVLFAARFVLGYQFQSAGSVAPLLIRDLDAWMAENDVRFPPVGEMPKSIIQAPLLRGGKPFGRISLENNDRTDAFNEGDVRLLTTLAGSTCWSRSG